MFSFKNFTAFEKKINEKVEISEYKEKINQVLISAATTMLEPDSDISKKRTIKGTDEYFISKNIKITNENDNIEYEQIKNSSKEIGKYYKDTKDLIVEYIYIVDNIEIKKEKYKYNKKREKYYSRIEYDEKSNIPNTKCRIIIKELMLAKERWIKVIRYKYIDNYGKENVEIKYFLKTTDEYFEIKKERYDLYLNKQITEDELFDIYSKNIGSKKI